VNLTSCPNSSLFSVWRPRARFIAPEGWQNDPQGLYQRRDGSYHAGYQCHPNHYTVSEKHVKLPKTDLLP
jgi:beta-fructofuranosidase